MRGQVAGVAAFGAVMLAAPSANADVSEVHVGVMAHNICVVNCKNANKEDGPDVEFQVQFDSPSWLSWAGSPEPYLVASVNTQGNTSHAGFGLEWSWEFADGWSLDPGVGYVVHNGENENPFLPGTPENAAFNEEHVLMGSDDLFRTSLALTRDFEGPWEGSLIFTHLSHGQILGNGRNQGMDSLGIRVGYQFGD